MFNASGQTEKSKNLNVLPSLIPFVTKLEYGMNQILKGENPYKSFHPIPLKTTNNEIQSIYRILKKNNINKIKMIGMEFELIFNEGISPHYYVRSLLRKSENNSIQFIEIEGENFKGKELYVSGQPLVVFKGYALPLKKSAEEFVELLKGSSCTIIPIITKNEIDNFKSKSRLMKSTYQEALRSKRNLNKICSEIKKIKYTEVHLRVDDMAFLCLDKNGKAVGWIKMDIRISMDTIIYLDMVRYRKLKE